MEVSSIITILYICLQLTALLIVSIISARIVGAKTSSVSSKKKTIKSWVKIMWKMRGIYGSFLVHSFDALTDILVIYDWWFRESKHGDIAHIDSRVMAYNSIAILILYKTVSTIAIWSKYHDIRRAMFQFMDILIFEEIYYAHLKLVGEINNKAQILTTDKTDTVTHHSSNKIEIDATLCFKYIRSIEAIFESMPQSCLQLVFAMRTNEKIKIIYVISVCQSILSMTNSIINTDNTQMTSPAFKEYKKKLPPSCKFAQHFFQALIVMPSDLVFNEGLVEPFNEICCFGDHDHRMITGTYNVFCCYWVGYIPSTGCRRIGYIGPAVRIGLSVMEFTFMILYVVFYDHEARLEFLVWPEHGLYVFVVTVLCFIVYTQYRLFFPRASLPNNIDPLGRYGAAFNGELEELKKINWEKWDNNKGKCCKKKGKHEIQTKQVFWDKEHEEGITCMVLALANEKYHVVKWLKEEGATLDANKFSGSDVNDTMVARDIIGVDYWSDDQ
eukprot:903975_1